MFFGFSFMLLMLNFSKYKQRNETCCADGIIENDKVESCFTCPHYDESDCKINERTDLVEGYN